MKLQKKSMVRHKQTEQTPADRQERQTDAQWQGISQLWPAVKDSDMFFVRFKWPTCDFFPHSGKDQICNMNGSVEKKKKHEIGFY